jgi:hypothetical protein
MPIEEMIREGFREVGVLVFVFAILGQARRRVDHRLVDSNSDSSQHRFLLGWMLYREEETNWLSTLHSQWELAQASWCSSQPFCT